MAFDLPPQAPDATPPPAIVAPAKAAEPIHVDSHGFHYTVRGNVLLPDKDVVATIEAAETPKDAIESLRAAYLAAGYFLIAVRAEVAGKLVAAEVINGRLTEMDIAPDLVPYFSSLEGRENLPRSAVIRNSALAEAYLARQGMRPAVNFAPATAPGGSKMTVTEEPIEGAKPWNASLGFNNLGSRFSSRYLAQAAGAVRPGGGLELTASYLLGLPGLSSDSSGSSYSSGSAGASIVTPWGLYSVSYQQTLYQIGQSFAPLFPVGDIGVGTISGSQLVYADETLRFGVTEAWTHTDNVVSVFDGLFDPTDQHYEFLSFGATASKSFAVFGKNANVSGGATLLQGISPRRGSLAEQDSRVNPRFTLVQGNLSYTQSLPEGTSFGFTWTGQWADATVPQNQQWVLGGFGNLTAWLPAILVGDYGTLTRATVNSPTWQWEGISVNGNAFVEAGMVALHFTPLAAGNFKYRAAGDVGLALSAAWRYGTSASLAYAWPVWTRNVEEATLNAQGRANLYFSLSQSF